MPASAGSAIWKSMSTIIPAASTSTDCPSSTCSVSGMVTGERTVETSSVASAWATSPSNIETHMAETTATGTEYSSTMPHTRFGSSPKNREPSAYATTGMATAEMSSVTSIEAGWRKAWTRLPKLFPRAPWNVMKAKSAVTRGLSTPTCSGKSTPRATHAGAMKAR